MRHEWTEQRSRSDADRYGSMTAGIVKSTGAIKGRKVIAFRNPIAGECFFGGIDWVVATSDFTADEPRYIAEPEWEYVTDGVYRYPKDGEYRLRRLDTHTDMYEMEQVPTESLKSRGLCYRRIPKALK